jgi:hypothetical protein
MKAKLPQSHFVSLSLAGLEFCFVSFSFSFALFRIFYVLRNLETIGPGPTMSYRERKFGISASRRKFCWKSFSRGLM